MAIASRHAEVLAASQQQQPAVSVFDKLSDHRNFTGANRFGRDDAGKGAGFWGVGSTRISRRKLDKAETNSLQTAGSNFVKPAAVTTKDSSPSRQMRGVTSRSPVPSGADAGFSFARTKLQTHAEVHSVLAILHAIDATCRFRRVEMRSRRATRARFSACRSWICRARSRKRAISQTTRWSSSYATLDAAEPRWIRFTCLLAAHVPFEPTRLSAHSARSTVRQLPARSALACPAHSLAACCNHRPPLQSTARARAATAAAAAAAAGQI